MYGLIVHQVAVSGGSTGGHGEIRLRVVPHFSSAIVERAKRERVKINQRRVSPFLAWGDFHARSRFAHSTIPEEKWGTTSSLWRDVYLHSNIFAFTFFQRCLKYISERTGNLPSQQGKQTVSVYCCYMVFNDQNTQTLKEKG